MNNFKPEEEFFIIDSNRLDGVKTRLYGWCIVNGSLVNSEEDIPEGVLPEPDGAYIFIRRDGDSITLRQDFIGCYGLYVFEKEGYFCLSNSLNYLVDYLKTRYPLTFNRDVAVMFYACSHPSLSFSETIVKEIRVLDRAAVVKLSVSRRTMELETIDYHENSIDPGSAEGIAILDKWYEKYCSLIRGFAANGVEIRSDLTGGFDSRMSLVTLLGSGIDRDTLWVRSATDAIKGHDEDYEIASRIAADHGFALNKRSQGPKDYICYSAEDQLDIFLNFKAGFHRELYTITHYSDNPRIILNGYGGGSLRRYWDMTEEEMIDYQIGVSKESAFQMLPGKEDAIRRVMQKTYRDIGEKYEKLGYRLSSSEITMNLLRETRQRHHFGRSIVQRYLSNQYVIPLLMDSDLTRLKTSASEDENHEDLLLILILARYEPQLLDYPVQGGRSFSPTAVEKAKRICEEFPYCAKTTSEQRLSVSKLRSKGYCHLSAKEKGTMNRITGLAAKAFSTPEMYHAFVGMFGKKAYDFIAYPEAVNYYSRQRSIYSLAVAKIIADCQASTYLAQSSSRLISGWAGRASAEEHRTLQSHPLFRLYSTARLDIKNADQPENDLQFLEVSDPSAVISSPEWFRRNGRGNGYVVQAESGVLDLRLKCVREGTFYLILRGKDIKKKDGTRADMKIDYSSLVVNDQQYLDGITPVSHDEPYRLSFEVKDGETISIHAEWAPHDVRL